MKRLLTVLGTILCTAAVALSQPCFAQTTGEIAKGNCIATAATCQKTLDYCTQKGGSYAEASVLNSLKDCITACKMTMDVLNRGSANLEGKSCDLAITACNNCAKSMDKFSSDTEMLACANECRKCVGNCQKLSIKKQP